MSEQNKNMNITTQHVCFVTDRSGSMSGKEEDTIGGINESIKVLFNTKQESDNIFVSLNLFDHEQFILKNCEPIETTKYLTINDFKPRGQTALLDAIGDTLTYFMEKKLIDDKSYDSCVIYIATDGYENASRKYDNEKIKRMIQNADEKYNIKILYLGANQDAIFEASKFGINSSRAMNYTENTDNVKNAYRSMANATLRSRTIGSIDFLESERQASQVNYDVHANNNINNDNDLEPPRLAPRRLATRSRTRSPSNSPPPYSYRSL